MRKVLAIGLLAIVGLQAKADDYTYLTFQKTDGTAVSLTAMGLSMTFAGSQVTVVNGNETATLNISELSKMFFGSEKIETGIDLVDGTVGTIPVQVYTTAGVCIGQFDADTDWQSQLSRGIYIIKGSDKAQKIVIR